LWLGGLTEPVERLSLTFFTKYATQDVSCSLRFFSVFCVDLVPQRGCSHNPDPPSPPVVQVISPHFYNPSSPYSRFFLFKFRFNQASPRHFFIRIVSLPSGGDPTEPPVVSFFQIFFLYSPFFLFFLFGLSVYSPPRLPWSGEPRGRVSASEGL